MIGFLVWKEDNGKSKKVTFKFTDGTERKFLVNGIDDFSQVPLNKVYEFETEGTWRNFEIIVAMREVVDGMDTVNKIKSVPTGSYRFHRDVPRKQVVIESITRL